MPVPAHQVVFSHCVLTLLSHGEDSVFVRCASKENTDTFVLSYLTFKAFCFNIKECLRCMRDAAARDFPCFELKSTPGVIVKLFVRRASENNVNVFLQRWERDNEEDDFTCKGTMRFSHEDVINIYYSNQFKVFISAVIVSKKNKYNSRC